MYAYMVVAHIIFPKPHGIENIANLMSVGM